jgi:hypothetical protein
MTPGYTGDPTDKQAIFDFVWKFLTAQGCRAAATPQGGCAYRNSEKHCCAAGCLLSDVDYRPEWEGQWLLSVPQVRIEELDETTNISAWFAKKGFDTAFLSRVQGCHDNAHPEKFVIEFQSRMCELAEKYNLTAPAA